MIRPATPLDANAIAAIYNHYVINTTITFEEDAVTHGEMASRIERVSSLFPWYVYERDGEVIGYAYATPWRVRSAYRLSVETSVYVAPAHARQGIGLQLYLALTDTLRSSDIQVALGGIAQPNHAK
jgi:L-amino acid N-acyltransferase YncA